VLDLHTHVLPGLDDGARTLEDSLEMARAALAGGIELISATPHVRDDYPTRAGEMERLVGELRARLAAEGLPLDVRGGGEIALDRLATLEAEDLGRFGLAGNPSYLLLEFPYYGWPLDLGAHVLALLARRITPVLAHPERNGEVQADPERLRPLVDSGALVQLTAASLDGRLGPRPRAAARELLERRLAHLLASDAHTPEIRDIGLASAAGAAGDDALARWLTQDVPAAIVSGEPLPPRPERPRRRRLRRR